MPIEAPAKAQLPRIAMRAEMLDAEIEYRLASAWHDHRDEAALHRLIIAYLRLAGTDLSLNASQSGEDESREWIEALEDDAPRGDQVVERAQDQNAMRGWLIGAMAGLSVRERHILGARHLSERPQTLVSLGRELNLSKERVRQIEAAALGKMRLHPEKRGNEVHDLLA